MTGVQVIQSAAWYPPHSLGGTEVYLTGLVSGLSALGVRSVVLTPRSEGGPAAYDHDGASVLTYPRVEDGAEESLAAFEALLRQYPGAIYHQHSWTPDCGLEHLRAARRAGMKTVLTVHVPSVVCMRGTMMRYGVTACDGRVREFTCATCWGQNRGAPLAIARAVAHLPLAVRGVTRLIPGRAGTLLASRSLAIARQDEIADGVEAADQVVAVCQWLYDALLLNATPQAKLSLSRQGVSKDFLAQARQVGAVRQPAQEGVLRLLYLGRWHPQKGIDVVVKALKALPDAPVSLTIHALAGGAEEARYQQEVEALIGGDRRVFVEPGLPRERIAEVMARHDVLAVPSVGMETGPLVALEARAVGLPVLGSRMGGLAELVTRPEDGLLAAPGDVTAWADAIRALAAGPPARGPVAPATLRTMDQAAAEMAALYRDLKAAA